MSKIGLIAATNGDASDWRTAAGIPIDLAPWIESIRDLNGLTFYSIICVPNWETRLVNNALLTEARLHLARRTANADAIAEQEAAIVDVELGVMPGGTTPLVAEWVEELDPLVRLPRVRTPRQQAAAEAAFPSAPVAPPNSDEAVCRSMIGPGLFGRMSENHRSMLASVIRRGNTSVIIETIRRMEVVYATSTTQTTPARPPSIPFADVFRNTAREERARYEAERAERIAGGAARARNTARRLSRFQDPEDDD